MVVVLIETAIEAVVLAGRSEFTPGLRVMLMAAFVLKAGFALGALRRKPGSAFGVLLFEATGVVVAAAATTWDTPARMALAASGVLAIGLMFASLHAFPTVEVPRP